LAFWGVYEEAVRATGDHKRANHVRWQRDRALGTAAAAVDDD